jgi:hypothetical protein
MSSHALAVAAVALLVTTAIPAALVSAQTAKPALVRDADEPGRNPYQEAIDLEVGDPGCTTGADCIITLSPVPAGKRLVVTYASVRFSPAGAVQIAFLFFPGGFMALPAPVSVGSNIVVTAGPLTAYIDAGQTPIVRMEPLVGGSGVNVFLSGYYISLP